MTDAQAHDLLQAAWDCGIRYFDTAPHYGLGLSERRLGAFLASKPRSDFLLSTKVGRLLRPTRAAPGTRGTDEAHDFVVPADHERVWDPSAAGVRRSLEESLQRLGLDRVDVLYLHDPEEHDLDPALATGVPGLVALREEGLVDAVGVGSKSTAALLAAARTEALDLLMVAGRYTLAEQPALAELLPLCRRLDVGVVNAAVFNTGLLATHRPTSQDRYEYGTVPDGLLARVRSIAAVCEELDVDLPTAALQYTLREPVVRTVVVGAATPSQVRQNAERMRRPVPEALWQRLAELGLAP
jgi:D-threo-aldose 1-dehydrogenase